MKPFMTQLKDSRDLITGYNFDTLIEILYQI